VGDPLPTLEPELTQRWEARRARVLAGERVCAEERYERSGGTVQFIEYSLKPVPGASGGWGGWTVFGRDITVREEHERQLRRLHQELLGVSRQAGMAEIASGILHNVGNTLNSVNVCAQLMMEKLDGKDEECVKRAAALLRDRASATAGDDGHRTKLAEYLDVIAATMKERHRDLRAETTTLLARVEHIRSIVSAQQQYAKGGGWAEKVELRELVEDALQLHTDALAQLGIALETEAPDLELTIDRHKVLQILVNLISNARHALIDSGRPDKAMRITARRADADRVWIEVGDNGIGMDPADEARVFEHGFTTKRNGHGFGLHMCALAAGALGGSLTFQNHGRGHGVTFRLDVPTAPPGT
jgi:signal transduction histidine kinase